MSEWNDIRGSHEEGEDSVAKLRDIHGSLGESGRAMLNVVLDSARGGETGAYRLRRRSGEDQAQGLAGLGGLARETG